MVSYRWQNNLSQVYMIVDSISRNLFKQIKPRKTISWHIINERGVVLHIRLVAQCLSFVVEACYMYNVNSLFLLLLLHSFTVVLTCIE